MQDKFKGLLNSFLGNTFGVKLYRICAHGRDDMIDIKKTGYKIDTIFDVGANIGQSAAKFRRYFPNSKIYCFEPVKHVFEKLEKKLSKDINTKLYSVAMGKVNGPAKIFFTHHDAKSSMIEPQYYRETDTVLVNTIDNFSVESDIQNIDLLKIDTEGFDLEVLKGADKMLSSGKIGFVIVETGFHSKDDSHVLFDDVRDYLIERGFSLFGIYDQQLEWSGENRLRYANVCFIRKFTNGHA